MRMRLLRFGLVALSVSPLFVACGSDSKDFSPDGVAEGGEGGETDTPRAGTGGSGKGGSSNSGDAGAAGAEPTDEGGAGGMPAEVGGAAGAGGEAGTAIVCTDEDGDGVTNCDGDCKDSKPYMFPGNPEICGDGIDNDCSFVVDDPCGGLGTYVSVETGDDANPGTKLLPVKTITKGIANAVAIQATTLAPIDVYVAQGDYAEKVTMVDGVSLLGAHNCDLAACDWSRDPSLYVSTITNVDKQGVLVTHNVFAATRIDGFTIVGMLDDGLAPAYPGTAAITVDGGSPTISNNIIVAGESQAANNWSTARAIGIAVLAPTNDPVGVVIKDNTISGGTSKGHSTGILFDQPVVNPAPFKKTYAVVTGNTISAGAVFYTYGIFARNTGDGTLIQDNSIAGGVATGGEANSWGINIESFATIDSNRINLAPAAPGCISSGQFCGGIKSASSTTDITNNVILGITDSSRSAAVFLAEDEQPAGSVVLNSNYLDGAGNKNNAENISAAVGMSLSGCCGSNGWIGRIANNIMVAGLGARRFGLFETEAAGKTIHPDWLYNNAFFNDTSDTPAESAYHHFWNGTVAANRLTIVDVNTGDPTQFVATAGNIEGDCDVDGSYHLQAGSICIDAGVAYDAPAVDYEGDARPFNGVNDIGADEAD